MIRTQVQPQGFAISAKQVLKVLIGKIRYLVAKTLYFYHTCWRIEISTDSFRSTRFVHCWPEQALYHGCCIKVDVAYRWPKLL